MTVFYTYTTYYSIGLPFYFAVFGILYDIVVEYPKSYDGVSVYTGIQCEPTRDYVMKHDLATSSLDYINDDIPETILTLGTGNFA